MMSQHFQSLNPVTQDLIWEGAVSSRSLVHEAVQQARLSFDPWRKKSLEERVAIVEKFGLLLEKNKEYLANCIGNETGKPLWESRTEVAAMIGKIAISISAYNDRTGTREDSAPVGRSVLRHRPHGVVAVFGPYNFPGHLPNGHIVPALIAGNTVVFKPSELTPYVGQEMYKLWQEAGLPNGVLNLVQGAKETGSALASHPDIDGLFFTGSSTTGKIIHKQFGGHPEKILALEMGGNNPLIVDSYTELDAAVHDAVFSAFVTAGQRCTCARRMFVPNNLEGNDFLERLAEVASSIDVGRFDAEPQPFMGSVISNSVALNLLSVQQGLSERGGKSLLEMRLLESGTGLLSPGIIDVSSINELEDKEHFGPLLMVIRYDDFEEALKLANATDFGLSAGLFSSDSAKYERFLRDIRAGIVNWNKPLTGASSSAPFGGIGASGNHRPSAYYAADYCAYPVASMEAESNTLPRAMSPGIHL